LIFKGTTVDDIKRVLCHPSILYHIDADTSGQMEVITWTTLEQLTLLKQYPKVVMLDGDLPGKLTPWLFLCQLAKTLNRNCNYYTLKNLGS